MSRIAQLSVSLLALSALPAAALDFGNGFAITGDAELEYVTNGDESTSFAFTDLTLSWRSADNGGPVFGVDLTNVSFNDLDSDFGESIQWFSLVVGTSYGEFALGRPRPLHDTLFDTPAVGASDLIDLDSNLFFQSLAAGFALLEGGGVDIWGATFLGTSGNLTYGAGLHNFSAGGDSASIYEIVGMYQLGETELYAGIEIGEELLGDFTKLHVGATYSNGTLTVGGSLTNLDASGDQTGTVKLFGEYLVLDGLTVGAQYQNIDTGGGQQTIYGLSGTYSFGTGGYAELGVADIESGGDDDTLTTASIGFKF